MGDKFPRSEYLAVKRAFHVKVVHVCERDSFGIVQLKRNAHIRGYRAIIFVPVLCNTPQSTNAAVIWSAETKPIVDRCIIGGQGYNDVEHCVQKFGERKR